MKNTKLHVILSGLSADQRKEFAAMAGTTVGYLYQIEGGHSMPSPQLAVRLERAALFFNHDLSRRDLRPIDADLIWGAAS